MKMTFRWFGEKDSIPLEFIKQIPNVSGVVTAVYDVPVGDVWPLERLLELKELSRNERFSKNFDEVVEVEEKKKYIPPMSHPWKLKSFLKQMEKSHMQHQYT